MVLVQFSPLILFLWWKSLVYLCCTHSRMPLILSLHSTLSLIISLSERLVPLHCVSQLCTYHNIRESSLLSVSFYTWFSCFFSLPLSACASVSLLEVNVLSCYTVCLSSSQTVTLEKWIGSISTSWRTRGAQQLRKKAAVYSARCCTLKTNPLATFGLEHCAR